MVASGAGPCYFPVMQKPVCPDCSGAGVPVVWGKPSADTLRAHDLGLVRAGGCILRGSPRFTWWCGKCEASFGGPDSAPEITRVREFLGDGNAKD